MNPGPKPAAERSEIPEHYKWDLERIYTGWDLWERDFRSLEESLPAIAARQGRLGRGAADLLDAMETVMDTRRRIGSSTSMPRSRATRICAWARTPRGGDGRRPWR